MAFPAKSKIIAHAYGSDFDSLITDLYRNKSLNATEISEKIFAETGTNITARSILKHLKRLRLTRSYSQAFRLAIAKGRKDYTHLAKPIKSDELRKGIALGLRYKVMKRDGFHCVLCGKTAQDNVCLVIDHIVPVTHGGTNTLSNLRTLCRACNHGKMIDEREK